MGGAGVLARRTGAVVPTSWSPGFIEELLPSSQQVSLLYHLSYLCLAKFPKLERLLRMRAVETQLLFGSSEAVLLKCVGTSQNLVSSLFPMLTHAVEKNKPTLAVQYLEKARTWINEIIRDVEKMVERYDIHNRDVATTTSDIITEKKETDKQLSQLSKDIAAMMETVKKLEAELNKTTAQLTETEKKIDAKNRELQNLVRDAAAKSSRLAILAALVPFIGPLLKAFYEARNAPAVAENIKALESELNQLSAEKTSLKQQQWNLQVQIIDWRMKLAKLQLDKDSIPEPTYLGEVQRYLTKIQKILIQLKGFWENVYSLLGTIKERTFVGEHLDEPDFKEEFLKSIRTASQIWEAFGQSCGRAVQIFRVQSKDAYRFLEIDPASLSQAVWQKEYDSVKERLQQLKVFDDSPKLAIQQ
ncbi:uncharacterized protein LOC118816288 [Colossoma macropomum]|uniref:uncharacterized protein LOC118816288 n=1 Tax=Colossoma macropomum TaxID=42526 RepID=UPI001863F493|nr:uncharacterized protein LOC118816288 [Colossoma macropomum]